MLAEFFILVETLHVVSECVSYLFDDDYDNFYFIFNINGIQKNQYKQDYIMKLGKHAD